MLWLLKEAFSVVCTRTIYLPPTVTSQFSTLTCGLVKSTASMAEDAMLFHANHIEVTLHFYLYRVSELNTQVLVRAKRAQVLVPIKVYILGQV